MLKIDALPAFTDNYIWLLQDPEQRTCVAVDPGDAGPVQAWLDAHRDWRLTDILITHHHHDHVGGVLLPTPPRMHCTPTFPASNQPASLPA